VTDDRVVNSEQKEAEAKKKTVVTRTVTRKYLKKPRRSTGPVDLEEVIWHGLVAGVCFDVLICS
jgi:hypothetical protein